LRRGDEGIGWETPLADQEEIFIDTRNRKFTPKTESVWSIPTDGRKVIRFEGTLEELRARRTAMQRKCPKPHCYTRGDRMGLNWSLKLTRWEQRAASNVRIGTANCTPPAWIATTKTKIQEGLKAIEKHLRGGGRNPQFRSEAATLKEELQNMQADIGRWEIQHNPKRDRKGALSEQEQETIKSHIRNRTTLMEAAMWVELAHQLGRHPGNLKDEWENFIRSHRTEWTKEQRKRASKLRTVREIQELLPEKSLMDIWAFKKENDKSEAEPAAREERRR
jgi:hypothetical protein